MANPSTPLPDVEEKDLTPNELRLLADNLDATADDLVGFVGVGYLSTMRRSVGILRRVADDKEPTTPLRQITLDGMQAEALRVYFDAIDELECLGTLDMICILDTMRKQGIDEPSAWLEDARNALNQ